MTENNFPDHEMRKEHSTEEQRYWQIRCAAGMQAVDGLKPGQYFEEQASRYIEGEIDSKELVGIVEQYYEERDGRAAEQGEKEAAVVATRINNILALPTFRFIIPQLQSIHSYLFKGLMSKTQLEYDFRNFDISKPETILAGDTVRYARSFEIVPFLSYDFNQQSSIDFNDKTPEETAVIIADFISNIWSTHPFAEGNTRTCAVFSQLYLMDLGYSEIGNKLFAEHSFAFRNALVRASYSNIKRDIREDHSFIRSFYQSVLTGQDLPFRSRDMFIDSLFEAKSMERPSSSFADHAEAIKRSLSKHQNETIANRRERYRP